jgi:transcriptional regulator with XRE-family HTH domain
MLRSRSMAEPRRGRPPNPVDPEASHAARLGAEIRARRTTEGLTLQQLVDLAGYTPQYLSEIERAKATPTVAFVAAVDRALDARGALERLLPPVLQDRERQRQERAEARRAEAGSPLRCEAATHSEVAGDDEDVEPTDRRGLFNAAGVAALGAAGVTSVAAPAQAHQIDPELPAHWDNLLRLLGRVDMLRGPQDVLDAVRRETALIAGYRQSARGKLRVALMRVEARWSDLAAWLSEDTGRTHDRDAWTQRAGHLAQEADDLELVAFWRARQAEWAAMARNPRAAGLAEAALSVPGVSAQTRAWSARQAALGHAYAGDAAACERRLHDAYGFLDHTDSPVPPWAHEFRVTRSGTRATEACCWLAMAPTKAIGLYDEALRDWPCDEVRDRGLHWSRLALACAQAGELDRAKAEGAQALVIAKQTGSVAATRELRRLGAVLRAA